MIDDYCPRNYENDYHESSLGLGALTAASKSSMIDEMRKRIDPRVGHAGSRKRSAAKTRAAL